MSNQKIIKRLLSIERAIETNRTSSILEAEYRSWIIDNPLTDAADFDFNHWADSMPVEFESLFGRDMLKILNFQSDRSIN